MKLFHQAGHNTNWNIESYSDDKCGNGIIFSPVHMAKDKVAGQPSVLRQQSFFDPQFYIPDSQKAKLQTYEFFPERITNGFSTSDFETLAHKSAEMCLNFQIENDFESVIVPARYFPELVTDYIERQKAFTVEPFLAVLAKSNIKKKVFLSLPVTTAMTKDKVYRQNLLNWITSYPEISGVYLLNEFSEPSKQISTFDKLMGHVDFIKDLKGASLDVIVGYCNTEAILLSTLNPFAITMGAYENTRSFSIDKFLEDDSDKRGPAPRLYFPKLLNWMRYDTAIEIKEDHPELWSKLYLPTKYSELIFSTGRPHFSQPTLYKHQFSLLNDQINELKPKKIEDSIAKVQEWLTSAKDYYTQIESTGVMYFDRNCSGDHLPTWNRVLAKIL